MVEEATPSRTVLVRRARRIGRELARLYPDARIELNFASPLELLVAAILSAQTTDRKGVDRGVPAGDPARSPGLSRPQARLRRVRSGPVVPVIRHGPDRRGDRLQARQDWAPFVTGASVR